jgi:hypothetical protein
MAFSDVGEAVQSLPTDEKRELQLLLQQYPLLMPYSYFFA